MSSPRWQGLLPDDVALNLLDRWAEPHRYYHGTSHLVAGLRALDLLGGERLERIAFWFHDAVHTNTTPSDEEASAALVDEWLAGHLPSVEVDEVRRLVLLTAGHHTQSGDHAGARLCDADLSGLGADWASYVGNVEGIRRELPGLDEEQWRTGRSAFLARFLEREWLFASERGRQAWERPARGNLTRELALLQA